MEIQYTLKQIDDEDIGMFIEHLKQKFKYYDLFQCTESMDIKTHTHDDYEARIFLNGEAEFIIDGKKLECIKGSYIEIQANVPHSFKYTGTEPLEILRFFSNEESWKAKYC